MAKGGKKEGGKEGRREGRKKEGRKEGAADFKAQLTSRTKLGRMHPTSSSCTPLTKVLTYVWNWSRQCENKRKEKEKRKEVGEEREKNDQSTPTKETAASSTTRLPRRAVVVLFALLNALLGDRLPRRTRRRTLAQYVGGDSSSKRKLLTGYGCEWNLFHNGVGVPDGCNGEEPRLWETFVPFALLIPIC